MIAPFTLRFVKDAVSTRFDACAADTEAARDRILAAGRAAGVTGDATCMLGLGAPSVAWADAAVPAIAAIEALGAGSVTISDTELALFAPSGVDPARFDEVVARLEAALPRGFTLSAEQEKASIAQAGPAEFSATADAGGVTLRGRITDERMRAAVESLARARFGSVDSALRSDAAVPGGWSLRVIAALEALDELEHGSARVSDGLVRISGVSGNRTASDLVAARLAQRLGAGARYELAIRYEPRLDPLLDLPSGAECVDRLNAAMRESEIGFEPSRSVIAGDPGSTLDRLATIMSQCADFRIQIGGHTDSQGSKAFNAELSRARAQAVLAAMADAGIDVGNMIARGFGASQPVADNDSEAGREANRRIEFTLLDDHPVMSEPPHPPEVMKGVTDAPEVLAVRRLAAALGAATGAVTPALGLVHDPQAVLHAATEPVRRAVDGHTGAEAPADPGAGALQAAPAAAILPEAAALVPTDAATRAVHVALSVAATRAAIWPAHEVVRDKRPRPRPESISRP